MTSNPPNIESVAIVGAGIIGLSCALELAERGVSVTVFEKQWPPRGASWAAAGMLAPAFESIGVAQGHSDLFALCDASARLWPKWAETLERESGKPSGFNAGPSFAVAFTPSDVARLKAVERALATHPLKPEFVDRDLQAVDPSVSETAIAGLLLPSDGQADNRLTLEALVSLAQVHPKIALATREPELVYADGGLNAEGLDATLLTAGWQTGGVSVQVNGRKRDIRALDPALDGVEPIGGQMLAVEPLSAGPQTTLRADHVYIVPKSDRIVIGATSEPGRVLSEPQQDQIAALRHRAIEICPILEKASVIDQWVGVRPGLKDYAPILGRTRVRNLFVASGHFRNGILLAPITAQIMADLIVDGETNELAKKFAPDRQIAARV